MPTLIIGGLEPKGDKPGYSSRPMKARSMIGGPDEQDTTDDEPSEPMGDDAAKDEAIGLLFRALKQDNPDRAKKALEAFIYACKE